jgi:hypothetical protein
MKRKNSSSATQWRPGIRSGLKRFGIWILACGAFAAREGAMAAVASQKADPAQIEFFEKSVRPLLDEHCLECHSVAKGKTKGGLALDQATALLKGGDTGPAIVVGNPEKSLLIKAVSYTDADLKMPPENKRLSPEQIAILQQWIRTGAYDPREGKPPGPDPKAAQRHWAFQPVQPPPLPAVKQKEWPRSPTDAFVLAALESKGLAPSPEADKVTLLKRVSYDLQGLPPTPAELQAFLNDRSPGAYERAVDRLLASPRFGERWGRHWLDVARYADTKGLPAPINADRRFHFSYTYRDYVIAAFNADKPFNEFLIEQLAADLLPKNENGNQQNLAALGFLTVGRCFQNSQNDIIDDRIDVVTRGMLGLTVTCARCHDHKYDPIPTADYYSLHGVFLSTEEPKERPTIGEPPKTPGYAGYLEKRSALVGKLEACVDEELKKINADLAKMPAEYLLAAAELAKDADPKALERLAGERKVIGLLLERWAKLHRNAEKDALFGPWQALASLPKNQFEAQATALLERWKAEPPTVWNADLLNQLGKAAPKTLADVAALYGKLCSETAAAVEKQPDSSVPLENPLQQEMRTRLFAEASLMRLTRGEVEKTHARRIFEARSKVQDQLNLLDATDEAAPPRAMALFDKAQPVKPVVFVRGNPGNRGPEVPRQFLTILSGPERRPFSSGSGRLEMARAIANPANPLTARVAVNRIWLHLFGRGLVETPNDFGVRTPPPAIPGALDDLANRFMEKNWSTKAIIRELVLSATYRQSSASRTDASLTDPNNDLLHAMRRRRLDFESLRDTMLFSSGRLEETIGGRPVDLTKAPFPNRRSVYGYIDRQDLPSVFRFFDFANPDISTGQRFQTSVPQQALFLLNSDFVKSVAESLARNAPVQSAPAGLPRVKALFNQVLLRDPRVEETKAAMELTDRFAGDPEKPWVSLSQVLLLTNEMAFVD